MKQRHCLLPSGEDARIEPEESDPDCYVAGSRCNPASNWLLLLGPAAVFEPVFVEMLVTELTVETLDVAVLHGATWLDQDVSDSMALRPSQKRSTREFRPIVCPHHLRVATK